MTNQNKNQGDLKSKCCNAPKHTHYMASLSMEGDLCRQCGKKFIPADDPTEHACPYYNDECPSCTKKPLGDQSTELGRLIDYVNKHNPDPDVVVEMLEDAYKLGALAAIEATKLYPSIIRADFGGEDFLFSSWDDAVHDQCTLSDAFLKSLP